MREVLQECALIVRDSQSFLGHLAFVFNGTLDERGNPSLDDIPVLLGSVSERFKERPETTLDAPPERNMLDFHEGVHEAIESIRTVRQGVEVVSEEEFGRGVDRETSSHVLEVDGLVGFEVGYVDESPVDVFVEEPEVRCPIFDKERSRGCAVLQENEGRQGREMTNSFCSPFSTPRHPGLGSLSQGMYP